MIHDLIITDMPQFKDNRGFFQELYKNESWPQCNFSYSEKGVFRGIHQANYIKKISCLYGEVQDFVIDLRPESPTYMEISSEILSGDIPKQIIIPAGLGHGFYSLKESYIIYFVEKTYEEGIDQYWHYKSFNLDLPKELILSEKDANAKFYKR